MVDEIAAVNEIYRSNVKSDPEDLTIVLEISPPLESTLTEKMTLRSKLFDNHNLKMVPYYPSNTIDDFIRFDESTHRLFYNDIEVSVIYYRHAYNYKHFTKKNSRLEKFMVMAEKSMAFSIPSIKSILVNMKVFQKFMLIKDFQKKLRLKSEDLEMIKYHTTDIRHIDIDFNSDKDNMINFVLQNPEK